MPKAMMVWMSFTGFLMGGLRAIPAPARFPSRTAPLKLAVGRNRQIPVRLHLPQPRGQISGNTLDRIAPRAKRRRRVVPLDCEIAEDDGLWRKQVGAEES